MIESLTIDEVVRRTGLTARALRFYEARGLLRPLRTSSGRRLYAPTDLERVHQIIALKKAGLSLAQMLAMFQRRLVNLEPVLRAQQAALQAQARDVAAALAQIETALSRIDRGEPLDAETLCSLIRDGDQVMTDSNTAWKGVVDRYFSLADQADWQEKMGDFPVKDQATYQAAWKALGGRIKAAMPLDPASDLALAFVREWFALLKPFTERATPDMWTKTAAMYQDMGSWQGQADPGFSKEVYDFIAQAARLAREAGQDIGPLPTFVTQR
jgi:MerR family transcriptional regulator, thiopeptide resistance regulator